MSAYFFYAAVFGFLSGVFVRTLAAIPAWTAALLCIISAICAIGFILMRKGSQSGRVPCLFAFASIACLAYAFGAWRTSIAPVSAPVQFDSLLNMKVSLEGVIVAPPDIRESSDRLTVQIERDGAKTRIIASAPLTTAFHVGDRVRVSGTLKAPAPFDSDGGRIFRYDQFLAKDGVFGTVQPAQAYILGRNRTWWLSFLRTLEYIKDAFEDAANETIPQPESALAIGIIAGGKQGLGTRLLDAFTVAGMLQIVVLSGYNVMIVAEGVLAAMHAVPKRAALIIAAITISLFVLAAGAGSSAVRAGIMALLVLTARGTHRNYDVLRALFAALVVMLLWNPLLLVFDPGLQLSFMATLGLVLGSNSIELKLGWIGNGTFREMLATTLAAQAAVLPLLLYQSGNLSLVAIPANLLAMPVLPAAMALSTIAAACAFLFAAPFPMLTRIIGVPAYVLLAYVIGIAEYSARIPYANLVLPAFPAWWLVPSYLFLGWVAWRGRKHQGPEPASLAPALAAHPYA